MKSLRLIALAALLTATPAASHDWYTGKTNPVTGYLCCDGQDCFRIAREDYWLEGKVYKVRWFLDGKIYSIPVEQVMVSEDGKPSACVYHGELRCLWIELLG